MTSQHRTFFTGERYRLPRECPVSFSIRFVLFLHKYKQSTPLYRVQNSLLLFPMFEPIQYELEPRTRHTTHCALRNRIIVFSTLASGKHTFRHNTVGTLNVHVVATLNAASFSGKENSDLNSTKVGTEDCRDGIPTCGTGALKLLLLPLFFRTFIKKRY